MATCDCAQPPINLSANPLDLFLGAKLNLGYLRIEDLRLNHGLAGSTERKLQWTASQFEELKDGDRRRHRNFRQETTYH